MVDKNTNQVSGFGRVNQIDKPIFYDGQFLNGLDHGFYRQIYDDGSYETGSSINGELNGVIIVYNPDELIISQETYVNNEV